MKRIHTLMIGILFSFSAAATFAAGGGKTGPTVNSEFFYEKSACVLIQSNWNQKFQSIAKRLGLARDHFLVQSRSYVRCGIAFGCQDSCVVDVTAKNDEHLFTESTIKFRAEKGQKSPYQKCETAYSDVVAQDNVGLSIRLQDDNTFLEECSIWSVLVD